MKLEIINEYCVHNTDIEIILTTLMISDFGLIHDFVNCSSNHSVQKKIWINKNSQISNQAAYSAGGRHCQIRRLI